MTLPAKPRLRRPQHLPVIAGYARGQNRAEIAKQLGISAGAVKDRMAVISRVAGVRGAAAVVNWAYENGYMDGLYPEWRARRPVLDSVETAVLRLVARGTGRQAIGRELGLTPQQVRIRIERINGELSTDSSAHATAIGWQQGLLGPDIRHGGRIRAEHLPEGDPR